MSGRQDSNLRPSRLQSGRGIIGLRYIPPTFIFVYTKKALRKNEGPIKFVGSNGRFSNQFLRDLEQIQVFLSR